MSLFRRIQIVNPVIKSAPPTPAAVGLSLPIRVSRLDGWLSIACHLLALWALTLTDLGLFVLSVLALLISLNLVNDAIQGGANNPKRLQRIDNNSENSLLIYPGRHLQLTLPRVRFYSEWFIVLQFDPILQSRDNLNKKQQRAIIVRLMPDSLDAESDRRLRRHLRFG